MHETAQFCVKGDGGEVMAMVTAGAIGDPPPAQYTGCHSHEEEEFEETLFAPEAAAAAIQTGASSEGQDEESSSEGRDCHFHAGVEFVFRSDALDICTASNPVRPRGDQQQQQQHPPLKGGIAISTLESSLSFLLLLSVRGLTSLLARHCLAPGETEGGLSASAAACEKIDRSYDKPIRIGTLFVMLITSSIAVFGPILLVRFTQIHPGGYIFTVLKQFGTGVIISTALVHLLIHAELMFKNPCLGPLKYEATTTAIVMAGAFLTFLLQYSSFRLTDARSRTVLSKSDSQHAESINGDTSNKSSQSPVPTAVHNHRMPKLDDPLSVLILEAGIIFHSAIIGVTLVVAGDSFYKILVVVIIFHQMFEGLALGVRISHLTTTTMLKKLLMGSAFALITPLGMAIGLGVLDTFNGKDRSTIIAIGTLDAFSAGILLWTGFVQMWSFDWLYGDLRDAGAVQTGLGMFALISGMVAMSVLGKWA
ncbi:MAG: hypothetical protein Q9192_007925 [Flavoplaca navasiana]